MNGPVDGPVLTAAVWIVVVLAGAARHRARVRQPPAPGAAPGAGRERGHARVRAADPGARRWSRAVRPALVVGSGLGLLTAPLVTGLALVVAAAWWSGRRRRHRSRQVDRARSDLPALVDLLAIVVASGGNLHQAVATAARGVPGLGWVLADHADDPVAALAAVDDLVGLPGLRLAPPIAAASDQGAPLSPVLQRLADDARSVRRRRAEAAARRAPVRSLAPLLLLTLPAFVLLTVAPLLASGLRSLHLDPIR